MKISIFKLKYLLIIGIVLGVSAGLYYGFIDDKFSAVLEGKIYRSAQLSGSKLQKMIDENGIQTIINLRGMDEKSRWHGAEKEISLKNKVALFDIRLPSHELPSYRSLNRVLDLLLSSKRPVLVHCWRGADRSGLASAMALAIEGNQPLSSLKEQISWRYGVLPLYDSIGPLVFSQYENWLKVSNKSHSGEELVYWIRNEYIDPQANLLFYIDAAAGIPFGGKNNEVGISRVPEMIQIEGWAMDAITYFPAAGLSISLNGTEFKKIEYRIKRPDVARFYNLDPKTVHHFIFGWTAEFSSSELTAGVYEIVFSYVKNASSTYDIPTGFKVSLKK